MPRVKNKCRSGRQNIARANAVRQPYVRSSIPDPEANTVIESTTLIPTGSVEEVERDGGDELGDTQEEAEHPSDWVLDRDVGLSESEGSDGSSMSVDFEGTDGIGGDSWSEAEVESEYEVEINESQNTSSLSLGLDTGTTWRTAESRLRGNSRQTYSQTPGARWARKNHEQRKERQRVEEAEHLQRNYGSIARFFVTSPGPYPQLPPGFQFVPPGQTTYLPPDFDVADPLLDASASTPYERLRKEISDLERWIQETPSESDPATPYGLRIDSLLRLLKRRAQRHQSATVSAAMTPGLIDDSESIAIEIDHGVHFARHLRGWMRAWSESRTLPPKSMRGKHMQRSSLFTDEGVMVAVREYLNSGTLRVTPKGICDVVCRVLQSRRAANTMNLQFVLEQDPHNPTTMQREISSRSTRRWLNKLGWIWSRDCKGYVDGHEREDVVEYRERVFLPTWLAIRDSLREWIDEEEIIKTPTPGRRRILVTHDESTFNANDDNTHSWKKRGTQPLKKKGKGKGLMVSEFLSAACGRLCYVDPGSGGKEYSTEIFKYGSAPADAGWWNSERMLAQVIHKAIPIFEKAYPDHIGVFAFDNSSGHACKAEDALVASRMNMNPGGKQPRMRDTVFTPVGSDSPQMQHMVFQPTDHDVPIHLHGQAKGMKRVLQERGLWQDTLKSRCPSLGRKRPTETEEQYTARALSFQPCLRGGSCCAYRVLESQPDFLAEKSLLEVEITRRGHECLFYPKFHCELNYIEFYWAAVKRYTREHCNYSFAELEGTVLRGLDAVSLVTIRRFANKSRRWIDAYISGLDERQQTFVQTAETSHRRGMGDDLV